MARAEDACASRSPRRRCTGRRVAVGARRGRGASGGGLKMADAGIHMAEELREAPRAVLGQAASLTRQLRELVTRLKSRPPQLVVTCARGRSAHAATFRQQ